LREIKFRAWDVKIGAYVIPAHTMNIHTGQISDLPDRFLLEQFTGLHDKNGKEIYEGDVVSVENSDGRTNVEVIFDEQRSWFAGFCIIYPDKSVTVLGDYQLAEIDAVLCGNIHENPELLNAR
jgi:uncharacterized phage protein (TIGR01671 family)